MKVILGTAAVLLCTTPAIAADAVIMHHAQSDAAAPVSTTTDWSGAYLGISAGRGRLDGSLETAGLAPLEGDFDGPLYGLFVGYNKQFYNNIVAGIEADLEHNENESQLPSVFGDLIGKTEWQGSVRGRLGYSLDRALIYMTAGYATTRAEAEIVGTGSAASTFGGYTVGAGIDYAVSEHIFGRIDYRYNDFGNEPLDFGAAVVPEGELSQHAIKVGLGVKF